MLDLAGGRMIETEVNTYPSALEISTVMSVKLWKEKHGGIGDLVPASLESLKGTKAHPHESK